MVNDFFLKTMELNSATINKKEFAYAIMHGYAERMFAPNG